MTPVDWNRVSEIFADALDRPPDKRDAWVTARCGKDAELRAAVERLLLAEASAGAGFLDRPDPDLVSAAAARMSAPPLERVGPWRLVREIGRGGMGQVLLAERADGQFEQRVAVKLLKRGMDSDAILARFLRERQILAALEHPNIARLLDGGIAEDGRPYFVMEYVDGSPITDYADDRRLDVDARVTLFRTVCRAVGHAHRNLVVHRDLKPSNILVTRDGEPKLLDFGIAKLLSPFGGGADPPTLTVDNARLMTPAYAAPEQLAGAAVTTATDVFGLGAVLYELLAGRPPFAGHANRLELPDAEIRPLSAVPTDQSDSQLESVAAARGTDPARFRKRIAGDLETIVAFALRPDPARRYASADALEADLGRHQERLPVHARPDTLGYRASRFVRRHTAAVTATAAMVLVAMAFGVTATLQARALRAERDRAQREAATAREVSDFMVGVFETSNPMLPGSGDTIRASNLLERGSLRVLAELDGEPELQARLLGVIGEAYNNLGWPDRAEPLVSRSLEIRRGMEAPDPAELVTALHRLAAAQANQARFVDAVSSLEEALRALDEGDPESPRRWVLLVALAHAHHGSGDADAGGEALMRAVEVFRRAPYGGSLEERAALTALTSMLGPGVDPVWADSVFERVVHLELTEAGPESERHAAALIHWGRALAQRGDLVAADTLLVLAGEIRRALGPSSMPLAAALEERASYALRAGDAERALPLIVEAVRIKVELLGAHHLDLAPARTLLADVQGRLGHGDEAVATQRLVVAAQIEAGNTIMIGPSRWRLAVQLEAAGRLDEADDQYRAALDAFAESFPDDYLLTANVRLDYGEMLASEGRAQEAEALLRAALTVLAGRWGEESRQADMARIPLGAALADLGRPQEARELLRPVVERLQQARGADDPLSRRAREALERIR